MKYSDPREYYCGLRREWSHRIAESERLVRDLKNLNAPIPTRYSLTVPRVGPTTCEIAVQRIRKENNRMLARRCRFYMLKLAEEQASSTGRELTATEKRCVLRNRQYFSEDDIEDLYSDDD